MNAQWFPLALANGAQVVQLPGGFVGDQAVLLSFGTLPAAGSVRIEYRRPGEAAWITPPGGAALPLTAPAGLSFFALAAAYRLTITGLVGGSGLQLWAAGVPAQGFPEGAFVGLRALTVQSYTEANVKNGVQFEAAAFNPALAALAVSNTVFTTGAKPVIIKSRQIGFDGAGLTARVFKNPTYTGGVPLPAFNLNDVAGAASTVSILTGVDVTIPGVEFGAPTFAIGSSLQGQAVQGTYAVAGQERILAANSTYLLQTTSTDAADAQRVATYLTWYEGPTDLPLPP